MANPKYEAFSKIIPNSFINRIAEFIHDDTPCFDPISILCDGKTKYQFNLYMKRSGVLCGKHIVNMVFKHLNCTVTWKFSEGEYIDTTTGKIIIAYVYGLASDIMQGERTALNLLKECSEIATNSRCFAEIAKTNPAFTGRVAATRKTTPGHTILQKYSVIIGDCDPHRLNLSDMTMIKDNARDICTMKGLDFRTFITQLKEINGAYKKIEAECRDINEAISIVDIVDIIMLDNFAPDRVFEVAATLKSMNPNILIEVSGGITRGNLVNYLGPNIDIISTSALFSDIMDKLDFSLKANFS
jgi:nicotinate-nucleotide pyrophosphorylase (carboxylating)